MSQKDDQKEEETFKPIISLPTLIHHLLLNSTMMISCTTDSPKPNIYPNMDWKPLLLSAVLLILSSLPLLFILPSSNTFSIIAPIQGPNKYNPILVNTSSAIEQLDQSIAPSIDEKEEECDLFAGRWVTEPRGSVYTNWTCPVLPDSKNCGKYGKGVEHVFWKWEPRGCEMPRFDPNAFLSIVRGKKMAFVGDSLARNQMESLLCLLTQAETGTWINNKGSNEKFQTWYYKSHDFTLTFIWAEFLVDRTERTVNGTGTGAFDLHLDRVNPIWAEKLPGLHYLIISAGNWFSRKNYYYQNGTLIGCVFCNGENVTDLGAGFAVRKALRTSLQFINRCEECDGGLVTLLRTYSPGHFEHGSWYTGGYCNRTRPLDGNETEFVAHKLDFRMIQLEEVEKVRKEWKGKRKIEVLDVTEAMVLRADGHPDSFFSGRDSRIASDCLHWCLPGPIDMWNDVLLATLKKKSLLL